MFKNLTNFAYKRDIKEAIGFYLAYLFLIILLATLFGGLMGLLADLDSFKFGMSVGNIVAIVMAIGISILILKKKNLLGNFGFIVLVLLSGLLAFFGGSLLGLIPAAFLTTRESQESLTSKPSEAEVSQSSGTATPPVSTPSDVNQEAESN